MLTIRKAQISDLDELVSMNLEVHRIHHLERPDEFKDLSSDDLRAVLSDVLIENDQEFLVCVDGDELMGYVYYRVESRDENPFQYARQHVYIDQIDVKLKHRRKGVGKQLIKSVIEKANEKGIDKIILDV